MGYRGFEDVSNSILKPFEAKAMNFGLKTTGVLLGAFWADFVSDYKVYHGDVWDPVHNPEGKFTANALSLFRVGCQLINEGDAENGIRGVLESSNQGCPPAEEYLKFLEKKNKDMTDKSLNFDPAILLNRDSHLKNDNERDKHLLRGLLLFIITQTQYSKTVSGQQWLCDWLDAVNRMYLKHRKEYFGVMGICIFVLFIMLHDNLMVFFILMATLAFIMFGGSVFKRR